MSLFIKSTYTAQTSQHVQTYRINFLTVVFVTLLSMMSQVFDKRQHLEDIQLAILSATNTENFWQIGFSV